MKIIDEMRERQAFEQPKKSSPLLIILGVVIAFGIGVIGVSGVVKAPSLMLSKKAESAVAPSGATKSETPARDSAPRYGKAETAPLLRTCFPFDKLGVAKTEIMTTAELYRIMKTASQMTRFAAMTGMEKKKTSAAVEFASLWGNVADCVYRQNGWVLCDPDNRALAVESAMTFVRQFQTAETEQAAEKSDNTGARRKQDRTYAMQNAASIKGRVLSSLRYRVSEGRLTASDFGMFAPTEIAQIVHDTKVTGDSCASRG